MGLIGLFMIFVTRKAQRLGDLMARTLVIHETKIDWSIFDQIEGPATAAPGLMTVAAPAIRLTSAQWELLHRYLNRRDQFEGEARRRLALLLVESLKPSVKGTELERSPLPPEAWLVNWRGGRETLAAKERREHFVILSLSKDDLPPAPFLSFYSVTFCFAMRKSFW